MIYTSITNSKDTLKPAPAEPCVAFMDFCTDNQGWEVRPAFSRFINQTLNAKVPKVVPHRFFEAEYSLWVDGTITVKITLDHLIDTYLQDSDIAVFRHPVRDCAYQEATACTNWGLDDPSVIQSQTDRYRLEGLPERAGLYECGVILRRHTPEIEAFCERWWREIEMGSVRDQISFAYCVWKYQPRLAIIEGSQESNELFGYTPHLR